MLIAFFLVAAAAAPQRVAAVLELRNKLEGPDRNIVDAAFLTDVVRQQILEDAPQLKLMTRENVISLLEASGKKLEECEGECEVDTGRRLGADLVVTGEVLRFGKGYRVNLRLHDTHSAQLLSAAVASGETPEALEKDLSRAVARLAQPLGAPVAEVRTPEWYETVGFYLTGALNSMGDGTNGTPRTLQAGVITISKAHADPTELGIGVRYAPAPWLTIDAAFDFVSDAAEWAWTIPGGTNGNAGGGPKAFSSSSIPLSVNYVHRIVRSFRIFGGIGGEYFMGKLGDPNDKGSVQFSNANTRLDNKFDTVRPLLRAGFEWRPQERFGIDVYAVVYPIPEQITMYVYDPTLTSPLYTWDLPFVSAHGALALYF